MNSKQWESFCDYKEQLKNIVYEKNEIIDEIQKIQNRIIDEKNLKYKLENSLVYNKAYEEITQNSEIKLIVVGDNPGWEEQLEKNQKYLVGQAGRIAEGYFRRNSELNVDFRKDVIITNKIPVHTPKTVDIKEFYKLKDEKLSEYLDNLEIKMAEITSELHKNLCNFSEDEKNCQLWMVGYSELKNKGIFSLYREKIKDLYKDDKNWENVYVFQHFSMNRFTIDLNDFMKKNNLTDLNQSIEMLGKLHKEEIFQ